MNKIQLFDEKKNCCACGACMNVCPKNAISMQEDEYGFVYPFIDDEKCVLCGMCKSVCAYQNMPVVEHDKDVYAASVIDDEIIMKSASGGIFAQIAKIVLSNNGIVFGCSLEYENEALNPKHIWIDSEKELYKLQGSKYVQSEIGNAYKQVKKFLDEGKQLLFSGTPCQIHGLKGFLKKDYTNLITIDIICHGVPNARLFRDYISYYEKKYNGKIVDYKFRDKKNGQGGYTQVFEVLKTNGIQRSIKRRGETIGYIWEFLHSDIHRENCYECKYATTERISDITLGDFWGIHVEHEKQLTDNNMSQYKGISCVLLNTDKGKDVFRATNSTMTYFESEVEKVSKHNDQLRQPSGLTEKRKTVMDCYKDGGYKAFEKYYRKDIGIKILYYWLKGAISNDMKNLVRHFFKK